MKKAALVLAVGLSTLVVSWMALDRRERALLAHEKTGSALRLRKFLSAGQSLNPEAVEEVRIPAVFETPGTLIHRSDLVDAQGHPRFKTRIALPKGDILTRSTLTEESGGLGLAWTLEPGQLAVSFRLSAEDAVGGHVRPGDRVQVVVTSKSRSAVLLRRILVAAVGERVWEPARAREADDLAKPLATDSIIVTLVVSPEDAIKARFAASQGTLTLALEPSVEG